MLWCGVAWGMTDEEQLRFADGIFLRGFYESAVGEYLVLLRDFPESAHTAAALYRTGECYRQMGNGQGAERFYKRVVTEFPESAQAARAELRRADLELAAGQYGAAAERLRALWERKGLDAETAWATEYELGLALWKGGDEKAAVEVYERMMESSRKSPYDSYAALDLTTMFDGVKKRAADMPKWFEIAVASAATPTAKAEAMYRWGEWAFRQGNYQEAAELLQSLRVEFPSEKRAAEGRVALGWSLYYLDRAAEAMELAEAVEQSADTEDLAASAAYLQANCLRKLNRDGEALEGYRGILQKYPGTVFASRAGYEVMATHFKRGDFEQALAAAPIRPEASQAAEVLWMRAESERQLHRTDAARGHLEELAADYAKSAQAPAALMRLGEMAREEERFAEAAEWYGRVVEEHPKSEVVPAAMQASALAYLRAGDAARALETWEALLKRKPDAETVADVQLQKALALMELDRNEEAMKALDAVQAATPRGPLFARARYWQGVLHAGRERWAEAEQAMRDSLGATPDSQTAALARLGLALALQRQQRMDEAADQVEPLLADATLVAANPSLVEWLVRQRFEQGQTRRALLAATELAHNAPEASWRQMAWYWVGVCRSQLEDLEAATVAYEKAIAEDAKTREGAEALLYLAHLDREAGRYDLARSRYSAAADAARDDADLDLRVRAYFGLGETEESAGAPTAAARHFMSVAVLFDDPEWTPHALYRAGLLLKQEGKAAEAAATWKELCDRYPESAFARQAGGTKP